ncbi:MAG: hypothetical protein ACXU9U_01995 [Parachlamydiaceae bacterium]
MNFILLCLFAIFYCGCTQELIQDMDASTPSLNINGKIIDGRYYPEDQSFCVKAHGTRQTGTRVIESKSDSHISVAFDLPHHSPAICYDVFPIDDRKAYLTIVFDTDYQAKMLGNFFHEIMMPSYFEKTSEIEIVHEDLFSNEDGLYYLAILKGEISNRFNLLTGKRYEEYVGIILTIKGKYLIAITYQDSAVPKLEDLNAAKQRLIPLLLECVGDFCPLIEFER